MIDLKITLPEHFLDEEERCGYTVSNTMKKVWAVELDLLAQLLSVAEKYNLKVLATGGTMLGAVRHHGFIPWDDDIDVRMHREDYNILCRVAQQEFKAPYFFQTTETELGAPLGCAKLRNSQTTAFLRSKGDTKRYNQGIFIDIFPYDTVTMDDKAFMRQRRKCRRLKFLTNLMKWLASAYSPNYTGWKGKLVTFCHVVLGRFIERHQLELKFFRRLEKECQRYNSEPTGAISPLSFVGFNKKYIKYLAEEEPAIMMPFEFLSIPVSSGYDRELRAQYGDYLTPVQAKSMHGQVFFDPDRAYTEYLKERDG